jgi:hypothetical protein
MQLTVAPATPDRAAGLPRDVDAATTSERGPLADHVGRLGAALSKQPLGARRVEAAGHRVLDRRALLREERPNLECLGRARCTRPHHPEREVDDAGAEGEDGVGALEHHRHPARTVVHPLGA